MLGIPTPILKNLFKVLKGDPDSWHL
jgi:hypothetical protein